ncbi:MAG: hypothetical protein KJ000_28980 [Pirellulaceae bacterium]|nr:hypothetical protein [Pirellulaceae bacterium]
MTDTTEPPETDQEREFAQQAEQRPPGIVAEFWDFLIHNKKWWITPIIVILLLMGALILLSSTPLAPFIYPFW